MSLGQLGSFLFAAWCARGNHIFNVHNICGLLSVMHEFCPGCLIKEIRDDDSLIFQKKTFWTVIVALSDQCSFTEMFSFYLSGHPLVHSSNSSLLALIDLFSGVVFSCQQIYLLKELACYKN